MSEEKNMNKYREDLILEIIKRYDLYITSTNFKVALHLTFLTAIFAALLVFVFKLNESYGSDSLIGTLNFLTFMILILTLWSASFFLRSVKPKLDNHSAPLSVLFFDDVSKFASAEKYRVEFLGRTEDAILKDLSDQAYALAQVLQYKMYNISKGANLIQFLIIPYLVMLLLAFVILL